MENRNKKYHEENKEQILSRHRLYHERNKDIVNAKKRARYQERKEEILAKQKAYREANRELFRKRNTEYRNANRESINARKREKNAMMKGHAFSDEDRQRSLKIRALQKQQTDTENFHKVIKCLQGGDGDKWLIQEITKLKISTVEVILNQLFKDKRVYKIRKTAPQGTGSRTIWTLQNPDKILHLVKEDHNDDSLNDKHRLAAPPLNVPVFAQSPQANSALLRFAGFAEHAPATKGRVFTAKDAIRREDKLRRAAHTGIKSSLGGII